MTPLQAALVEQVKYLLTERNITQKELSRRVGKSEKHVSQMLTGACEGTLSTWQRLLEAAADDNDSDTHPERSAH